MDEGLHISDDWVKNWRASIAIKITAAVLYGVVFVGLVFTIFSLQNVENKIKSDWSAQADQFAYQIAADLEGSPQIAASTIESAVRRHFASFHFSGVALTFNQQRLLVGQPPDKTFSLIRLVHINGPELQTQRQAMTLEIFFPPIHESAKARRNGLFALTGVVALLFGFFLTWVIRMFITRPFQTLIHATNAVSGGDLALRLDTRAADEFGYLARFFNRMLDQINAVLKERLLAEDALRASETQLKQILDSIHAGVVVIDPETHKIVDVNDAALKMIGSLKEQVLGRVCHNFICPAEIGNCPISDHHFLIDNSERELLIANGGRKPILKSVVQIPYKGRNHLIESFIDISNLKHAQAQITKMAYYDSLTNLPNRLLFQDRLQLAISHAMRHRHLLALLFVDLDNFKRINDTLGHQAGDLLLKEVALRLTESIRSTDTVTHRSVEDSGVTIARQGGDEFTILITEINQSPYAAIVAQRFLETLARPFMIAGHEVFITASIGVALYPIDGEDLDTLLKNADIAMYEAKSRGKNNYQYFQQTMNVTTVERLSMEARMRRALDQDEFVLFYQPQIDIRTGTIIGMEALLRWQHPDRGIIMPDEFIPLAEEVGLIVPLGEWVLRTACAQNREWQKNGHASLRVSVNISGQQLQQHNFIETVAGALEACGLEPGYLMLEITESIVMQHSAEIMDIFYELSSRGVRFSMDDFGTGYSSLSYLKSFIIHEIKIDRAFVKDITIGVDDTAIARAIIAMARSLNLHVVAEGVETEPQMKVLCAEGCYAMQGNIISHPIPVGEVLGFLTQSRGREEEMRISQALEF
ncbi:MAG: EAL domain-containing protein [Nitrospirae bacterium]|nr:EAL domain-containing protein [Nitrospirota bacterium]